MNKEINVQKLTYPSATEWMWNYCIYLGPFTLNNGDVYDLGVCIKSKEYGVRHISLAAVFGNEPGDYLSGPLTVFATPEESDCPYIEAARRCKAMGILDKSIEDYFRFNKGIVFQ